MWPTEGISINIGNFPSLPVGDDTLTAHTNACMSDTGGIYAACREREKQRVQELSSTLQTLAARVQEQAVQDAEAASLQRESDHLQKLCRELDAELAVIQQKADVLIKAEGDSPESIPAPLVGQSSGETSQGSLQSTTIPCNVADAMQQHHTMYEAYEFQVGLVNKSDTASVQLALWWLACLPAAIICTLLCCLLCHYIVPLSESSQEHAGE